MEQRRERFSVPEQRQEQGRLLAPLCNGFRKMGLHFPFPKGKRHGSISLKGVEA